MRKTAFCTSLVDWVGMYSRTCDSRGNSARMMPRVPAAPTSLIYWVSWDKLTNDDRGFRRQWYLASLQRMERLSESSLADDIGRLSNVSLRFS